MLLSPDELPFEALPPGAALREGALVIENALSQSQFAIIYRARDTRLERDLAIKEYFPLGCSRQGRLVQPRAALAEEFERAKAQFLAEAQVLARFRHPGIVSVFDFFAENNTAYLAMEYLDGPTLEDQLQNTGAMTVPQALAYILEMGEALQVVHDAALLHCDIKPENVMACTGINGGERIVLVDFGLTKRLDEAQGYGTRRLNDAGHFGTPGYAPIEQYTHTTQIGAYTDVYALGATLYRLLTDTVPASAADRAAGAEWKPPHQLNPRISRSLSQLIEWAMQMSPAARPSSVSAWLNRLRSVETEEILRRELIGVLQARLQTLQYSAPAVVVEPIPSALPVEEFSDDPGCFHACFIGCIVMWFISAALALMGWALKFVLVPGG